MSKFNPHCGPTLSKESWFDQTFYSIKEAFIQDLASWINGFWKEYMYFQKCQQIFNYLPLEEGVVL